jgi:anti-sigma28 factor (negative regulator of flagellin synthesis)
MLTRLALRVSLFAICTSLATGYSTFGDEREEIKLRIVQIEKQAAQLLKEGRKDKAAGLLREQEELMQTLEGMNSQGRFEGRGPSPEQMEKSHKATEQVHHLRIASEHLKLAGMHEMAGDLMRRVEDIEQDLRNANLRNDKEKMAQQMRADRVDRGDRGDKEPPRDQPQREPNRKDQPERPRAESRGPQNGLPQNGGPDGFIHRLQEQLDQVRAENRELRTMVEKIASGLMQSDKPQIDKPQTDKPQIEERMLQFAERAIQRKDTDKNGVLTPDEFKGASGTSFSDVDTNQDGKIDIKEYATYISRR